MAFKSIILGTLLVFLTVQFNTQAQTSSTAEDPLVTLLINKGLLTKEAHTLCNVGRKYYAGSDLRFFLSGQLLSNFNDTTGLSSVATANSIDGASSVAFGFLNG